MDRRKNERKKNVITPNNTLGCRVCNIRLYALLYSARRRCTSRTTRICHVPVVCRTGVGALVARDDGRAKGRTFSRKKNGLGDEDEGAGEGGQG